MPLDQIDVDNLDTDEGKEMTFLEHLEELRWHIIRAVSAIAIIAIVVFMAKDFVFNTLLFGPKHASFPTYQLICSISNSVGLGNTLCFSPPDFDFVTPIFGELFITHIKVSIVLGLIVAFPYVFWEIWRFIKPGLYESEQKYARGIVGICSLLFLSGVLFGYFVIAPFAVTFLGGYQIEGVQATPSLASYVSYMTMFTLPAGVIFELPVVVYFFSKIGLITPEFLRSYRRHAFIIILLLSAIITPPDMITQLLIGVPLYFLYEISIIISKRVVKAEEEK